MSQEDSESTTVSTLPTHHSTNSILDNNQSFGHHPNNKENENYNIVYPQRGESNSTIFDNYYNNKDNGSKLSLALVSHDDISFDINQIQQINDEYIKSIDYQQQHPISKHLQYTESTEYIKPRKRQKKSKKHPKTKKKNKKIKRKQISNYNTYSNNSYYDNNIAISIEEEYKYGPTYDYIRNSQERYNDGHNEIYSMPIQRRAAVPIIRHKKFKPAPARNVHLRSLGMRQKEPKQVEIDYRFPSNQQSSETLTSEFTVAQGISSGTIFTNVNADDLQEEIDELKEELQAIKNRKFIPKTQKTHNIKNDDTMNDIKQSCSGIIEYKKPFDTLNIHTIRYPYDQQKRLMVYPFWKKSRYCCQRLCICLVSWIFILSLVGAIMIGGVYTTITGKKRRDYGESFNIKGECEVVASLKKSCDDDCEYDNSFRIEDLSVCDDVKDWNYRINDDGSSKKYGVGQMVACYTNSKCDEVFVETGNTYKTEGGWIYFGASVVFLVGLCILYWFGLYYYKDIGCDHFMNCKNVGTQMITCCDYYYGIDKRIYYEDYWKYNMTFHDKLDYFIGFYRRRYGFNISGKISELIYNYNGGDVDDEEEKDGSYIYYNNNNNNNNNKQILNGLLYLNKNPLYQDDCDESESDYYSKKAVNGRQHRIDNNEMDIMRTNYMMDNHTMSNFNGLAYNYRQRETVPVNPFNDDEYYDSEYSDIEDYDHFGAVTEMNCNYMY